MAKSKPTKSLVSRSVIRSPTLDPGVSYSPVNHGMQSHITIFVIIITIIITNIKQL